MRIWFSIVSDLFINLAAAWFALVLIEPYISPTSAHPVLLTTRFLVGILSLVIAKKLKEESENL